MGTIRSVLMILQIIILVGIVGTSLTSAITISLLKGDFDGGCPLYPSFIRREAHVIYISLNDVSNCQYIIGFNAVALVLAILIGVGRAVEVIKQQGISDSPLFTLLMGILCGVITLLALISACIVTMGFKALCHQLVSHEPNASKCVTFQNPRWKDYDGRYFYNYLSNAQITSWVSVILWLLVGVATYLLFSCFRVKRDDAVPILT